MTNQVRPSMQLDNALNILACLDRFSLDSVGFTCPTLKGIVDEHLPEGGPLRVLESVILEGHMYGNVTATLVPESPLGGPRELTTLDDDDADKDDAKAENAMNWKAVLHDTAALCANSYVKLFKMDGSGRTFLRAFWERLPGIRIQRMMVVDHVDAMAGRVMRTSRFPVEQRFINLAGGVESLLMKTDRAAVDAGSLRWLKERGIRQLAVDDRFYIVGEDGVRAFCIGDPETADEAVPERSIYLRRTDLSFEFLQQLAQECLMADAGRVPTVIFYRYEEFVPPLPEHQAQARHGKSGRRCLHFRFHVAAGPYEIVAQRRGDQPWKVTLRGGHSAVRLCEYMRRRENWYRELEEAV